MSSADDLPLGSLTLENNPAIGSLDEVEQKIDQVKEKAVEASEHGLKSLIDSFGELTVAGFGVEEIISKVEELGAALIEAAVDAENHARAMDMLGDTADRVASATNDMVEAEDAWRAQQRLTQAGLHVTADQLAAITQRAREYALATGTQTPQALEQLTQALRSGEAGGLRQFGISIGDAHDRTTAFNNAIAQLEQRAASATPSARTLGEEVHRTSNNLHDAVSAAAGWIAEMSGFQSIISSIGDALGSLSEKAEDATSALDRARQHAQQATTAVGGTVRAQQQSYVRQSLGRAGVANLGDLLSPTQQAEISGLSERLGLGSNVGLDRLSDDQLERITEIMAARRGDQFGGGAARGEGDTELFDILRGSLDNAATAQANQSVANREASIRERVERLRAQQRERGLDREARRRAGIHEGGSHHNASSLKDRASDEAGKREQEVTAALEREYEQLEKNKQARIALETTETQEAEAAVQAERSKLQAANDLTEAYRRQHSFREQMSERAIGMLHLEKSAAQATAESMERLASAVGASFEKHLLAVVKNEESFGEAVAAMGKEIMEAAFRESIVMAAMEGAKGIASAATGDYPGAAEHAAAAAAFGGVAVLTGIGTAAASAPTQQQAVPPANNSLRAGSSGSPHDYDGGGMGGGKLEINLTVGGNVYGREHAEEEIFETMKLAARRAADFHGLTSRWNG